MDPVHVLSISLFYRGSSLNGDVSCKYSRSTLYLDLLPERFDVRSTSIGA